MALPKITSDLNIIAGLPTYPDSATDLEIETLKHKFDEAGLKIQTETNNALTAQDVINTDIESRVTINTTNIANRYTKTETDTMLNIKADKSTTYTKSELDNGQLDNRYYTETEIQSNYYDKTFLDGKLRGGDTLIKYEVFTIVHANNGNGTFTYNNGTTDIVGQLVNGYQRFTLTKGTYVVGNNRIEAVVNDTLSRSVASGGLREVGTDNTNSNIVDLTINAGDTAEITFKYFERLGLAGEHASSHGVGQSDELVHMDTTAPSNTFAGQILFQVV